MPNKKKTPMAGKRKTGIVMERGGGNVFADLGLANPEQEQLKARLTLQIYPVVFQARPAFPDRTTFANSMAERGKDRDE